MSAAERLHVRLGAVVINSCGMHASVKDVCCLGAVGSQRIANGTRRVSPDRPASSSVPTEQDRRSADGKSQLSMGR